MLLLLVLPLLLKVVGDDCLNTGLLLLLLLVLLNGSLLALQCSLQGRGLGLDSKLLCCAKTAPEDTEQELLRLCIVAQGQRAATLLF